MEAPDLMEGRCRAKSKRSGRHCKRPAIAGGTVCYVHGGAAPQVREKARQRLAALVNPAIRMLAWALESKQRKVVPALAVRTAIGVLDREVYRDENPDIRQNLQVNVHHQTTATSNTAIQVGKLTDEEIALFKRLLEKVGLEPAT